MSIISCLSRPPAPDATKKKHNENTSGRWFSGQEEVTLRELQQRRHLVEATAFEKLPRLLKDIDNRITGNVKVRPSSRSMSSGGFLTTLIFLFGVCVCVSEDRGPHVVVDLQQLFLQRTRTGQPKVLWKACLFHCASGQRGRGGLVRACSHLVPSAATQLVPGSVARERRQQTRGASRGCHWAEKAGPDPQFPGSDLISYHHHHHQPSFL